MCLERFNVPGIERNIKLNWTNLCCAPKKMARETSKAWLKLKRHFAAIFLLHETKYQSIDSRVYIFKYFDLSNVALIEPATLVADQLKQGGKRSSSNKQTCIRRLLINHLRNILNLTAHGCHWRDRYLPEFQHWRSLFPYGIANWFNENNNNKKVVIYYCLDCCIRHIL